MQSIRYHYSALYRDFAKSPELTRFRRFSEETTWLLYGQSAEIEQLKDECNTAIQKIQGFTSGNSVFTDLHLVHLGEEHAPLIEKIRLLHKKLRRYNKDLCRAYTITQLPEQAAVFSKQFAGRKNLCENGRFGPTGESDVYYKHPPHPDTCTLKDLDPQDSLTELFIDNVQDMTTKLWGAKVNDPDSRVREGIRLSTIRTFMNILTSLYVPLVFTVSIAVLDAIQSTKLQIAVAGVLGIIISMSVQLLVPVIKRSEVFAVTAAYFAVAGVFIGASTSSGR